MFSVKIIDLESKVNINFANREMLQQALDRMGVDGLDASTVLDSIEDWRDPNTDPHVNGAESDYYLNLPRPYVAKDGPFDDLTELPGLIAALDSRPGVGVQRLSVHRDDWDEIPHRLTADAGHVIRVDWFTTIPRHTISVTTAGKGTIEVLVVPPGTAEGTAQTAMNMAATGPGAQAADILTASQAQGRLAA